jgi:hypothetical protein
MAELGNCRPEARWGRASWEWETWQQSLVTEAEWRSPQECRAPYPPKQVSFLNRQNERRSVKLPRPNFPQLVNATYLPSLIVMGKLLQRFGLSLVQVAKFEEVTSVCCSFYFCLENVSSRPVLCSPPIANFRICVKAMWRCDECDGVNTF